MSNAQAGGQKGRATTDHLLILKEIIKYTIKHKKNIHVAFLDVTKAFDKAWLEGILHVLNKNGLHGKLWRTISNLNSNLKAQIKTKHGLTETINIKHSIRQGGILSGVLYALQNGRNSQRDPKPKYRNSP